MSKHENTSNGIKNVSLTPAQLRLLDLVDHLNAADFAEALKEVHELGTYYVSSKDLVNLSASRQVHWLYDAVFAIALEGNQQQSA